MRTLCAALLAALVLAAGCATTFEFRRQELLAERVKQYGKLIRWSEFEGAQLYLTEEAPGRRTPPPKEIRVTDYEVKQLILTAGGLQAGQVVQISYFNQKDARVRTMEDVQQWVFDPEKNEWFLKSGLPDFK